MQFKEFLKNNKVVKGQPDKQKSKALLKKSEKNIIFIQKIPVSKESASIILTSAYECLRQVLEAISLTEGYKVYSHEAYTYYLKEKKEISTAEKFERLRKLRNGINYYGKDVSPTVAKEALITVKGLCRQLKKKYL